MISYTKQGGKENSKSLKIANHQFKNFQIQNFAE